MGGQKAGTKPNFVLLASSHENLIISWCTLLDPIFNSNNNEFANASN